MPDVEGSPEHLARAAREILAARDRRGRDRLEELLARPGRRREGQTRGEGPRRTDLDAAAARDASRAVQGKRRTDADRPDRAGLRARAIQVAAAGIVNGLD